MKKTQRILLTVNIVLIAVIFVLNYFYQKHCFDFTLKCVCSGLFALIGLINLVYALKTNQPNRSFYIGMALGLVLAMLGDVLIGYDFIIGAAIFALGHICFSVAYCFIQKIKLTDCIIGGILFLGGASFLLFSPLLTFKESIFRVVCIIYALIISTMLGKAIGNFVRKRDILTGMIALASALFFFSDLMLVLDWFVGRWNWTDNACMGTYYPALCILAFSMFIHCIPAYKKRNAS